MKLYILFGSQTSNAEELAHDLAREASRRLIPVEVLCLDDMLEILLEIKLAIFVVSTTGQGEPPVNMRQYWRGIMSKTLPKSIFSHLNFTVFGLGDSTYQQFNVVARKLWVRMKQLGGVSFLDKGLGDDIHDFGYEAEYHPWCEQLWKALEGFYPVLCQVEVGSGLGPSLYRVECLYENADECIEGLGDRKPFIVQENRVLTERFGTCFQVDFENEEFGPGDSLAVYPKNSEESVRDLMTRLNWRDSVLSITLNPSRPYNSPQKYPQRIRLSSLLSSFVDLHHPASRHFIEILAEFSEGLHQTKLREMSERTLDGRNEYHRYITKEYRNVCEVLYDFSSISTIPLEYFLQGVRIIRPREFSIAGGRDLRILASLVKFKTPLMRTVTGLCTGYLKGVKRGDAVYGKVVRGGFVVPELNVPVIFVATGTGIAPLWSIIESRISQGAYQNFLFFGTRHPDHDFYFKDQIEAFQQASKCLSFIAFSQTNTKTYVQDLLKSQWELVNSVLKNNGHVLICGKAKQLVKSVKSSLITCLEHEMSEASGTAFLSTLEQTSKFYAENW